MLNTKLKKTLNIISWGVFAILAVVFVLALSPLLPIKGVPKTYAVVSGSMEPTIGTGSLAVTKYVVPKDLKVGDIVVFTSPSNNKDVILHRIIEIKSYDPLRYSTKGDANVGPDSWDLMDVAILGKYIFSVPYVGYVTAFVRKPLGYALLIGIPALLLIINQIIYLKKAVNEEIEKRVNDRLKKTRDQTTSIISLLVFMLSALILLPASSVRSLLHDELLVTSMDLATSSDLGLYPDGDCEKNNNDDNNGKEDEHTNRCKDKEKEKEKEKKDHQDSDEDKDNSDEDKLKSSSFSAYEQSETSASVSNDLYSSQSETSESITD